MASNNNNNNNNKAGSSSTVEASAVEEDEVVREVDVYLAQNLAGNLSIFQYPLRQPWRKYPMDKLTDIKMRPQHQRMEMSFELETDPQYYNEDCLVKPEKVTLTSSIVQQKTNYAIGIFKEDAADEVRKLSQKKDEKEEEEPSAPMDVDDEFRTAAPKPVQVRFKESARSAMNQKQTIAQGKKLEESEPWQVLKFYDDKTVESVTEQEKLYDITRTNIVADVTPKDYLPQLCPTPAPETPHNAPPAISAETSMETLKSLSIEPQVREILRIAQIIHFGRLRELATSTKNELDILPLLSKFAYMVAGRWVARSELCYTGPLIIARDYILFLFSKQKIVARKDVQDATGVSADILRQMLSKLAIMIPEKRGWQLKIDPDDFFLDIYPDYLGKVNAHWVAEEKSILQRVSDLKQGKLKATGVAGSGGTAAISSTIFRGTPEAMTQLNKFISDAFGKYGVLNWEFTRELWRNSVKVNDPANKLKEIDDDTFKVIFNDSTVKLHAVYILKLVGDPQIDKFRNIIVEELKKNMKVKLTDIHKKCKEVLKDEGKATVLGIMGQLTNQQRANQGVWILKDGNGTL